MIRATSQIISDSETVNRYHNKSQKGDRSGRLEMIRVHGKSISGYWYITVRCDCGNVFPVNENNFRRGLAKGCGCKQGTSDHAFKPTHRESGGDKGEKSPEYATWGEMKKRCFCKTSKNYPHYGGRGITVCERWEKSYEDFLSDMGRKPSPQHSIDRIDNNGNYEPGNCRWATKTEQASNTRRNKTITALGKTMTAAQWARETGVSEFRIYGRLRDGWNPEDALFLPPVVPCGLRQKRTVT